MNAKADYGEPLEIGYSSDDCREAMHRPDQRVLYFVVSFEDLNSPPDKRDYRTCLSDIWSPFLRDTGLSACIMHHGWHPERGPIRSVVGWVWRQHGSTALGNLSEFELFRLSDHLRAPQSKVMHFVLTEQFTTLKRGNNINQRKLRLVKSAFLIEPPPDQALHQAVFSTTNKEA